jgi:homoserine dehydrogenase
MRVGIGIVGAGVVGGALASKLIDEADAIEAKSGLSLEVVKVGVRDLAKARPFDLPADRLTDRPEDVVDDPDVQLVVELMGGLEPAGSIVQRALEAGKPVVTANKELVASRGLELSDLAHERGVALLYEAAVGGGIPIIRPLSQSLAGERLTRVMGIVNGTTNFILTKMTEEGAAYSDVLAEAQVLGYAESDPTADVSGADAAAKAAILASLAFGSWIAGDDVPRSGIDGIEVEDLIRADDLGYVVKLLAIAEESADGVAVRVKPTLVPHEHPLAAIRGAQNAIFVEGDAIGQLLFAGPGAGGEPTATAVLGDVIDAARELLAGAQVTPPVRFQPSRVLEAGRINTSRYYRLIVNDAPGVLARIAEVFGDHEVSIASVWQEGMGGQATLLLVTHQAPESSHDAAVADLERLDAVAEVAAVLRVLDGD